MGRTQVSEAEDLMRRIDALFSHVWMVRTFLKHSDEAEEDDELCEVHRQLYDVMLSLGGPLNEGDPEAYLRQVSKKRTRLKKALELFLEIQPEVSGHTNFKMAAHSLETSLNDIFALIDS